jgi:hypothetical protein
VDKAANPVADKAANPAAVNPVAAASQAAAVSQVGVVAVDREVVGAAQGQAAVIANRGGKGESETDSPLLSELVGRALVQLFN